MIYTGGKLLFNQSKFYLTLRDMPWHCLILLIFSITTMTYCQWRDAVFITNDEKKEIIVCRICFVG
jgi:hypothetical protein